MTDKPICSDLANPPPSYTPMPPSQFDITPKLVALACIYISGLGKENHELAKEIAESTVMLTGITIDGRQFPADIIGAIAFNHGPKSKLGFNNNEDSGEMVFSGKMNQELFRTLQPHNYLEILRNFIRTPQPTEFYNQPVAKRIVLDFGAKP